jgi:hypothetical protein
MVGKKGPFGGFCNYGIFGIWGKDPGTGKQTKELLEVLEKALRSEAVERITITIKPNQKPKQS